MWWYLPLLKEKLEQISEMAELIKKNNKRLEKIHENIHSLQLEVGKLRKKK